MRNHLEVTLKKYYRKEGNRVVFQNGMSLNQLAMVMWENLGFKGIDPSVVSRVINGKRLFTIAQLRVFCQILDLPQDQRNILFLALSDDVIWRFGAAFFRKLIALLVPPENSLSCVRLPFSQKSYYSLLDYTLHHRRRLLDPRFAGFDVSLPVCSFAHTVVGLENNCRCGYHLFLYGVISRAFHFHIFSHNQIQREIGSWTNFFFPMQAVVGYLKKSEDTPSHHQLLEELAIS
ncbi:MAG: hypothetical protein UU09_C0046G0018 [Microgenomates group bacterium GW2011_GWA2_40_6]|nr:MAG: hypothetical protein UU09_C0046G0018 [Microgenomates group bacterium GW2011_GWA2_40_6]